MNMKEIDNENATQVNATRGNLYIIHKQKLRRNRVLEKAKTQTFYKNAR